MIMYEDKGFKFDRGEGSWLYSGSNKYLDLCAGTFNVLVGWGNKEISDKVVSVLNNGITIDTTHVYNQYAEIASKKLLSLSSNMNRVHFKGCPDGSLAVEQAIKHAFATNKNGGAILSLTHSHHGQSIFISNISGLKLERTFTPKLNLPHSFLDLSKYLHNPNCYFNISPSDKDSILKEIFSDIANYADLHGGISCFIFEPILGCGGGYEIPSWLLTSIIAHLKNEYATVIIADEIQTFARLGEYYSSEKYGADIICLAKGISGIGVPGSGAILMRSGIGRIDKTERSLTWGASPIACAAISSTVDFLLDNELVSKSLDKGKYLKQGMLNLSGNHASISNIRGKGLMVGFDIESSVKDSFLSTAFTNGLLVRDSYYGYGNFIKLRPTLTISYSEMDYALEQLDKSLSVITAKSVA